MSAQWANFFRDIIAPEELRKELVELAFDYA